MTEQEENSKQLVLCHFEPKDTTEYIKSKVDICAEHIIEKFKRHELQFDAKKQLLAPECPRRSPTKRSHSYR